MSAFAKSTFSATSYAAFRPSYPTSLYSRVLAYHRGPKQTCLDLGCGTGIVTREMIKHFDRVIGTDPSPNMVRQARDSLVDSGIHNVEYRQASAEQGGQGVIEDGGLDMVVAGQSAHWFDYNRLWPEMARLVRRQGTLAFWGYKDHVFVDFPKATEIMQQYAYEMDPEKLGPYWTQPGRSYVQDKLRVVKPPAEDWEEIERIEYEPKSEGRHSGEGTLFMERRVTVGQCKEYVRTWSSFHSWQEAHPKNIARSQGGKGDLLDEMFDLIAQSTEHFRRDENEIDLEWGSALIMARRR